MAGSLAAGGDINLRNYSVGVGNIPDADRTDVLAAGSLTFAAGSAPSGSVQYGSGGPSSDVYVFGNSAAAASEIDFAATFSALQAYSVSLAAVTANGTTTVTYSGPVCAIDLSGTDASQNIFTLRGEDLASATSLTVRVPSGSTAIINVNDATVEMGHFAFFFVGGDRQRTLLNMPAATSLTLDGIGVEVSILAPKADVSFENGQLNGQLVAQSFTGQGQLNESPFIGCAPDSHPTYSWHATSWSACVAGQETRTITCVSSSGATVPDASCDESNRPAAALNCTSVLTYSWLPGEWSACSASGTQVRTVTCVDSTQAPAIATLCNPTSKPSETQACNAPVTYSWRTGDWGVCSIVGVQTRDVSCYGSNGAPAASCDATTQPISLRPCTLPLTYGWRTGDWSVCSVSGDQSRSVTCIDSTGATALASQCDAGTRPAETESCTPPVTYSWQVTEWATCVAGNQTRTVTCVASTGGTVANSFCDAATKPVSSQPCDTPPTYAWRPGDWATCSAAGSQSRSVICVASTGETVADSLCGGGKPATTQSCTPPVTYSWQPGTWGTCSASGIQTRSLACLASTGSVVASSFCSAVTPPATSQSCTPPVTYGWRTGDWSTCSAAGSQSRSVTCVDSNGATVANSFCGSGQPATTQSCTPPVTYSWQIGSWSACSAAGTQTRTVTCLASTGATVANSSCGGVQPASTQSCTPPVTYSWQTGAWGTCSGTGTQTRTVTCVASTGGTVASTNCDAGAKPATSQTCSTPPPGPGSKNCTYTIGYWKNHSSAIPALLPQYLGTPGGAKTMVVTTAAKAVDIESQNVYGDSSNGITKLYAQMLASKLAFSQGANRSAVSADQTAADVFLATHDYTDWAGLSAADQAMVLGWHGDFDDFNNGRIGPGHCP